MIKGQRVSVEGRMRMRETAVNFTEPTIYKIGGVEDRTI